jgi:hypothetical protein
MAAITPTVAEIKLLAHSGMSGRSGAKISGASASGSGDSLTTAIGRPFYLKRVAVHYAAGGTHAAVTVGVDSSLGANYDHTLFTGTVDQQNEAYIPTGDQALFDTNDEVVVSVPAQTTTIAYIVLYVEYA